MPRTKIDLPDIFQFITEIPIRISDINYGGHAGNDSILALIHEARLQYLKQFGYSEIKFEEVGLIMADVEIVFKNEVFYGDTVLISVTAAEFSKVSFDIFYKLEKLIGEKPNSKRALVAAAKTGMVCFDYSTKKIAAIPEKALNKLRV